MSHPNERLHRNWALVFSMKSRHQEQRLEEGLFPKWAINFCEHILFLQNYPLSTQTALKGTILLYGAFSVEKKKLNCENRDLEVSICTNI